MDQKEDKNTKKAKFPNIERTFFKNIRSTRLTELPVSLSVIVGDLPVELVNISESGLAFKTSEQLIEGKEYEILIRHKDLTLHKDHIKISWIRKENNMNLVGGAYSASQIGEDILSWIEKLGPIQSRIQHDSFDLDPVFCHLTLRIREFLKKSKKELDEIESVAKIQSWQSQSSLRTAIDVVIADPFVHQLKLFSKELDQYFSKNFTKEVKQKLIQFFRDEVGEYYASSNFIGRALKKPLGYAGDYEMMNQVYRNQYEGGSLFEYLIHKYGVNEDAAYSIRYRKGYFRRHIEKISEGKTNVYIASLACGPAQEVVEFLEGLQPSNPCQYTFVLIDQDQVALLNAKRNITEVVIKRKLDVQAYFLPVSVKDILEQREEAEALKDFRFDLMYSAGLYDYLTQPVAKILTTHIYELVADKGLLILGNFHPRNPSKTIKELSSDWKLIHRDETQMFDLISNLVVADKKMHFDDLEIDCFLEVTKK